MLDNCLLLLAKIIHDMDKRAKNKRTFDAGQRASKNSKVARIQARMKTLVEEKNALLDGVRGGDRKSGFLRFHKEKWAKMLQSVAWFSGFAA